MPDDLQKHTLNLRAGDYDYLDSLLSPQGIPTAQYIRLLVAKQVDAFRAAESQERIGLRLRIGDQE